MSHQTTLRTEPACLPWYHTKDGDPQARALYRRHYSYRERRPGETASLLFVGPGEKLVLITAAGDAVLVWRHCRYRRDAQEGVECTLFRNESAHRSLPLILAAQTVAWQRWPGARLFTFVNPARVRSSQPGRCFQLAGWTPAGTTRDGKLLRLERLP